MIAFIDETGVRTWAPRGKTPVIRETFGWKSLSIIGAISLWRRLFRIHPGAIKGPQVVDFLKILVRHSRQLLMVIARQVPRLLPSMDDSLIYIANPVLDA